MVMKMFRKQLIIVVLLLSCAAHAQQTKQPYYYQTVNSADKAINFVFGLYPATISYFEGKDFPPYTSIRGAVVNQSAKDSLKWNNFKVDILLKSGQLVSNYMPFSKDGPFACNYTVSKDSTHYQIFCFHTKFISTDIDRVWLQMSTDEIINLVYEKNE